MEMGAFLKAPNNFLYKCNSFSVKFILPYYINILRVYDT